MNLKTYQAYSMAEALAAVKRDLGADAVILNTRTYKRGGVFGLGRRTIVELTATSNESARSGAKRKAARPEARVPTPGGRAALRAYGTPVASAALPADAAPTDQDRIRTKRLAQAMLEQHERKQSAAIQESERPAPEPAKQEPAEHATSKNDRATVPGMIPLPAPPPAPGPSPAEAAAAAMAMAAGQAEGSIARRYLLTTAETGADAVADAATAATPPPEPIAADPAGTDRRLRGPEPAGRVTTRTPARVTKQAAPAAIPAGTAAVHDDLAAIREMVGQVLQRQTRSGTGPVPTMPQRLFDQYLHLLSQDISEELADRIVNDVRDDLSVAALEDEATVRESVRKHLADYIPTAEQPIDTVVDDGRPLTIALVGPTGVGKTTTLAKLAASFKLRHGKKVGLVTADTYRIAAVDQLRTYANIIGLPLQVVLTPGEMRQATAALADRDVILIDTAGRSQNDTGRLEELRSFIEAANPHEVHLVLSGTAGEKVLLREAEAFGVIGVDKIVLTKLDEAVSFGTLVSVVRQVGKRLSFFTTGQEVPDHIEVGRPERLAALVMGEGVHP